MNVSFHYVSILFSSLSHAHSSLAQCDKCTVLQKHDECFLLLPVLDWKVNSQSEFTCLQSLIGWLVLWHIFTLCQVESLNKRKTNLYAYNNFFSCAQNVPVRLLKISLTNR